MNSELKLSVVIPLFNEEPNVRPLVEAVREALGDGEDWELLLVDDGSVDGTAEIIAEIATQESRVRLIQLARNYGQTTALQAGFDRVRGSVVVSLDGDMQNDPRDIHVLTEKISEGYDIVVGRRTSRQDKLITRKVPSWLANRLIQLVTGVRIHDLGCGLKAYRRDILQRVELYSDLHRFIPVVAAGVAAANIAEVPRAISDLEGTGRYPHDHNDPLVP
jgi:glycosyltransferase involved in cell wall biosynthesis